MVHLQKELEVWRPHSLHLESESRDSYSTLGHNFQSSTNFRRTNITFTIKLYVMMMRVFVSKESWQTKSVWPVNFPGFSRNGLLVLFIGRDFFTTPRPPSTQDYKWVPLNSEPETNRLSANCCISNIYINHLQHGVLALGVKDPIAFVTHPSFATL